MPQTSAFTVLIALQWLGSFHCSGQTFQNPIFENLETLGSFGSIVKHGGYYYLPIVPSDASRIQLLESLKLSNFRNAESSTIYEGKGGPRAGVADPNLYKIGEELYTYFKLGTGIFQSLFVIKCVDPSNPLGEWTREFRLMPGWDRIAYQPSVLQYPCPNAEGQALYLLWSSPETGNQAYHMYIAKMHDPMTANSTARLLRSPQEDRGEGYFNESPFAIQRNHRTFLTFSTQRQNSDRCLRIMGINCGMDPMAHSSWWDDVRHCVFEGEDEKEVVFISRASFVMSPDDKELWMVYAASHNLTDWNVRDLFIQKAEWEMESPKFPLVAGRNESFEVPSGE